jgi:hypothetical protein
VENRNGCWPSHETTLMHPCLHTIPLA